METMSERERYESGCVPRDSNISLAVAALQRLFLEVKDGSMEITAQD